MTADQKPDIGELNKHFMYIYCDNEFKALGFLHPKKYMSILLYLYIIRSPFGHRH